MDDEIRILPEILAHVFKFLDARAKLNASSVCKRWMEVLNDNPGLYDDICVNINESTQKTFSKMTRNFSRFIFISINIHQEFFLFLERFGHQFRSLTFCVCTVQEEINQSGRKLQNCKQLLELKMWDCNVFGIFPFLPALKSVEIYFDNDSNDRDLELLRQITPLSLTHFKIGNSMVRDDELIKSDVEDFIHQRRFSIQSLEFVGRIFLDCDSLSKMEGLRLKRLSVDAYWPLNSTIESFCSHQPGIVALDIAQNPLINGNVVAICTALPLLEELSLTDCPNVNESVATIFQLKRLRRLQLIQCSGIKAKSFRKALEVLACSNLEILNLCKTYISCSTLSKLLTLVPNLREIHLSETFDFLKAQWVECPWLEYVAFSLFREREGWIRFVRRPSCS